MNNLHRIKLFFGLFLLVSAATLGLSQKIRAQTWNSNAGGYNGGYGQVYSSFGLAQATIAMQNEMNLTIQKAVMRQAMIKKFGKAATDRAINSAARQSNSAVNTNSRSANPNNSPAPSPVSPRHAFFVPSARADNFRQIIDIVAVTNEEKAFLKNLFSQTKIAFENEVAPKGRKNNFAAALTFFIASAATVYHDDPEPNDTATENLFLALNSIIDESPEMRDVPNDDKQKLYDSLIAFGGLVYAGYLQGKDARDAAMLAQYRQIAGAFIEMILKTNPDRIRFVGDSLQIKS